MAEDSTETERIAELEADNRRLRRLLDQRDAPGELRHRLRGTLTVLRTIIRKSAHTDRDLEGYVGHLEDRLDALMRAQSAADERGSIDLHKLVADELLHYGTSEDERATLTGPEVELQPRAGQVLALAVHELAVNAVEHGSLGTATGRVEIAWRVSGTEPDVVLTFIWRERGATGQTAPAREGFGTEVLTRMLAYELKAESSLAHEPDGILCTIRVPLTDRVGRLARS
jgi:two-component sensor histidine kinase